jgi:hypothetical protein
VARFLRERLSVSSVLLGLLLTAPGCLSWTPPVDDDDGAGDDDDATSADDDDTGDDDDTTAGDDDDTTAGDDDDSVSLSAHGVIVLALATRLDTGASTGGVAAAAFSDELLSPSAEEAAYEDVVGIPILTFADSGGSRESGGDLYEATYLTGADNLYLYGAGEPLGLEPTDNGWRLNEFDSSFLGAGESWSTELNQGPFAGGHTGPVMPTPPGLVSDRLLSNVLYLHPSVDTILEITDPQDGTSDVLSLLTALESETPECRTHGPDPDGRVRIPGLGGLNPDEGTQIFVQRTARSVVDVDGQSLLLVSSQLAIGSVWPLQFQDSFLSPQNTVAWTDPAGSTVAFEVDPPVLGEGSTHSVQVGSMTAQGTVESGLLVVAVDPTALGLGWVNVEMQLPTGGFGRGAVEVSGDPPGCDLVESGQNDTIATAGPVSAGQVICGTIDPAGDFDVFEVQATLGVTYRFEIWAQRIGSETDSYLTVYDAPGNQLAENDDWEGLDSLVEVTATQAGPLYVQVRDYDATREGPNATWRLVTTSVASPL